MEQKYKKKIEHLQKFLPFLQKLIERLKTELDNEAKVVQLQLFHNLLICPDPSVTIEDLEKCEEALTNFYKTYHSDTDELLACKEVNVATHQNLINSTTKIDEPSDVIENKEAASSKCEKEDNVNEGDVVAEEKNIEAGSNLENKGNETESCIEDCKSSATEEQTNSEYNHEENITRADDKKIDEMRENGNEVQIKKDRNENVKTDNEAEGIFEKLKTISEDEKSSVKIDKPIKISAIADNTTTTKDDNIPNILEINLNDNTRDQNNVGNEYSKNSNHNVNKEMENSNVFEPDNVDDDELEGNVELVKMPEAESDEMILPDSEGDELQKNTIESEEKQESNVTETCEQEEEDDTEPTDNEPLNTAILTAGGEKAAEVEEIELTEKEPLLVVFKTVSNENLSKDEETVNEPSEEEPLIVEMETVGNKKTTEVEGAERIEEEPLLVAMETVNDENQIEAGDPLNVDESKAEDKEVSEVIAITNEADVNRDCEDDDDDDVQVIETRNSPICIDSDDDVPPATKPPPTSIRRSERKKSIKVIKANHTKSRTSLEKNPKDRPPQACIIDLIELLDSSDDDSPAIIKPQPKTPMKRCLLPKPIRPTERVSSDSLRQTEKFIAYTPPKPPTQVHISTPQSNFLNAVNLQPANTSNPPAFSTQLSNKNIIIPNAFYGNPPEARGIDKDKTLRKNQQVKNSSDSKSVSKIKKLNYQGWLENFMTNFANPQQKVSNPCYVILQRVLKFKFFQKVKDARRNLDIIAQTSNLSNNLDVQLMLELRQIFFNIDFTQLSDVGIKFCEFATNQTFGKPVALTTDIATGRITSRTRGENEVFKETATASHFLNGFLSATPPSSTTTGVEAGRKKQKDDEQDEYTPNKPINENEFTSERKRSLRTNRVKRVDNSFSYNEDHDDTDEEEDDSYAAVKRKVEQKRREAKRQREQMAKSFESAFIQTFAKNITESANAAEHAPETHINGSDSKRQRLSYPNSFRSNTVSTDLTFDEDSLDEGLKQHRIYKVLPEKLISASSKLTSNAQTQRSRQNTVKPQKNDEPEIITCSDDGSEDDSGDIVEHLSQISVPKSAPKNTSSSMHIMNKDHGTCVICKRIFQRIVHHYVNEHRGCEVYTSRLTKSQLTRVRQHTNYAKQSVYKNGQNQYEGTCVFCQKRSRFMLGYWYQHYTMHTGEYAYRCSGCGIRKPTRSLLQAHVNASCKKRGKIKQDYKFDSKAPQIGAHVCTLCNYVQLHRNNIVQHLRAQHNLKQILPKHIQSVILLKWNTAPSVTSTITTVKDSEGAIYEIEELDSGSGSGSYMDSGVGNGRFDIVDTAIDNNEVFCDYYNENSAAQFNYDAGDPGDDLSFMICGMLDVQMDAE